MIHIKYLNVISRQRIKVLTGLLIAASCFLFYIPLKHFFYWQNIWRRLITIAGEGWQIFNISSALMAIEQWGFFIVPHLSTVPQDTCLQANHLWGPDDIQTCCSRVWEWNCHFLLKHFLGSIMIVVILTLELPHVTKMLCQLCYHGSSSCWLHIVYCLTLA